MEKQYADVLQTYLDQTSKYLESLERNGLASNEELKTIGNHLADAEKLVIKSIDTMPVESTPE